MLANVSTHSDQPDIDPFVLYAQSLHDYTLRLWTESRRKAEQQDKRDRIKMGLLPPDPPKGTLELTTRHRRTTDMNLQSAWRT